MKVKDYKVKPLTFDEKLVKQVMDRVAKEESIAVIAKQMGIGPGRAAMAVLIGTTERKQIDDPAALARAIAKDRRPGRPDRPVPCRPRLISVSVRQSASRS